MLRARCDAMWQCVPRGPFQFWDMEVCASWQSVTGKIITLNVEASDIVSNIKAMWISKGEVEVLFDEYVLTCQ